MAKDLVCDETDGYLLAALMKIIDGINLWCWVVLSDMILAFVNMELQVGNG
jgi:hypothetical protein